MCMSARASSTSASLPSTTQWIPRKSESSGCSTAEGCTTVRPLYVVQLQYPSIVIIHVVVSGIDAIEIT